MTTKTKFSSYCINGIAEGCKHCIQGKKLVLFITGKCSRNCEYCSLSNLRKNKDDVWANERKSRSIKEIIKEVEESNADSAGITGGDPLLKIDRTIKYAKALKDKFGEKFHIHIYLPTNLITEDKIKRLSEVVDEIRIHPGFLRNAEKAEEDIEKIKLASKIIGKKNLGIEMPMFPDKEKEMLDFILSVKDYIDFVNLNELESSETNLDYITSKYKLKEGGYIIDCSKEAGIKLLEDLEKENVKLKVHLCTAETKNNYQYANRLKIHNILPYGYKTKEGTVIYLTSEDKTLADKYPRETYYDKDKERVILSEELAKKLLNDYKIKKTEEFPTFDRIIVEEEYLN